MDATGRFYLRIDNLDTKDEKRYLASPTLITKADESTGTVDAIVSVMGNIDLQDDIIHQGAFLKTIQERGKQNIRVLDNHNFWSVEDAIATVLDIQEVTRANIPQDVLDRFPATTGGLLTSSKFMLDDPKSLAVFRRLKSGAINQYSIGFQIVKQDWNEQEVPEGSGNFREIRNIREVRLFEYSPVIFAANPATVTVGVKSMDVPITINMNIVKRAATAKACGSCIFYGKVSDTLGYCKQHDATTKAALICDTYSPVAAMRETYGKRFAVHMERSLSEFVNQSIPDESKAALTANIPDMVNAITRMLPSDIVDMPLSGTVSASEPPDKNQPSVTDNPSADAQKTLAKQEREALILAIRERQKQRQANKGDK